ncbi:MAG: hypothetical protein ACKVS9_06350 [Phycisphaerae bacterium]
MKRIIIIGSGILLLAGCPNTPDLLPFAIQEPTADQKIVPGGISNLTPFFGKFKRYEDQQEAGDFLLGSCGCGDWRVLFRDADGDQTQFPVGFYTAGEYQPTGEVLTYGTAEGTNDVFSGTIDQDTGDLTATARVSSLERGIEVARVDIHGGGGTVLACIMCHLGDDPIYPLDETHPGNARRAEAGRDDVCLECHSANGQ